MRIWTTRMRYAIAGPLVAIALTAASVSACGGSAGGGTNGGGTINVCMLVPSSRSRRSQVNRSPRRHPSSWIPPPTRIRSSAPIT
jgi:hypothetical protein